MNGDSLSAMLSVWFAQFSEGSECGCSISIFGQTFTMSSTDNYLLVQ